MALTPYNDPVRPERGIFLSGEMWTGDIRGRRHKDITEHMADASVTYKWDDDISGTLQCSMYDTSVITAIEQTLIPILNIQWKDNNDDWHRVREQLGVFYFLPSDSVFTQLYETGTIEAYDGTWALNQLTTNDARTVKPDSADLGDWASTVCYGQTELPLYFKKTGVRPGKTTNWTPNERSFVLINDFYTRAGFWPVKAMRNGAMLSPGQRELLYGQQAERRIDTDALDVIGDIQIQPEREDFANQVFLSSTSAIADLTMRDGYKITNTDPNDRWSLPNLGYVVSHELSDSTDENFDTMRRRAISILEKASTMKTRITVPTFPDPRFDPYAVWELNIKNDRGWLAASRWRVEEMTFGFTPSSAAQVTTLGKMADLRNLV